jgi:hypothetical protein
MDNRYFNHGCPALMNDGRFITNYNRFPIFEQYIKNINNISSVHEYKKFLQQNGDLILNNERAYFNKINTCILSGNTIIPVDKNSCGCD